ncbi:MAG: hypothetical protein MUQ30_10800 [Anaerolineae bacterium]|nr:hypothetical protein [Anaerolineae bacterium]
MDLRQIEEAAISILAFRYRTTTLTRGGSTLSWGPELATATGTVSHLMPPSVRAPGM